MKTPGKWEVVGAINIHEQLSIAEASCFFDEPTIVPVSAGRYTISLDFIYPEGHKHVGAIRVARTGGVLRRGEEVGTLFADFAQTGICDRDAWEAAFEALGDERIDRYYDQLKTIELYAWARLDGAEMLLVRTGFGAGRYPVFDLLDPDGEKVGVEVDCVAPIIDDDE